jgi:hypothetical protein
MGAFTNPEVINLTFDAIEKNQLWYYPSFQPLRTLGRVLRPLDLLSLASRLPNPDANGTLISEVNKVTYRTPDVMLSAAQDDRPGEPGFQQHIRQATLGPYAVVFVTNPGSYDLGEGQAYWTSNGRMPRNAQYRNVLISIYNIDRHVAPGGLETCPYGFTHAYFPKWAFDEVVEAPSPSGGGGWLCGAVFPSALSLDRLRPGSRDCRSRPTKRLDLSGGAQGDRRDFSEFHSERLHAGLDVKGLQVAHHAAGTGELRFGWTGPLTVYGKVISLHGYPRWDNPVRPSRLRHEPISDRISRQEAGLGFRRRRANDALSLEPCRAAALGLMGVATETPNFELCKHCAVCSERS